ncbi:MAG TPA: hypothetical protein VK074_00010, partial [Fodinibius sp.]|nr:hypothetical protein [Fodinibius sp.]
MVDNKNKHIGSSPDKGTKPEGKGVKEDRSINPDAGMRGKPRRELLSVDEFVAGIENGSRATLSRAITLVESTRPEHREKAR